MKLIIYGSRTFNDYEFLKHTIDIFLKQYNEEIEIVSGTSDGADKLGEQYAKEKGFKIKQFPADWKKGKIAGYLRNKQMAEYGTHAVGFWDGKSKGTKMMNDILSKLKKYSIVITRK